MTPLITTINKQIRYMYIIKVCYKILDKRLNKLKTKVSDIQGWKCPVDISVFIVGPPRDITEAVTTRSQNEKIIIYQTL